MKLFGIVCGAVLACVFGWNPAVWAAEPAMPSQPAPMIVGAVFRFETGAWAEYDMLDKLRDQPYTLRVAVLEQEQVRRNWFSRRRPYRWMEFDVQEPGQPRVVVKGLMQELDDGPGDMRELVMQIEGYPNPLRLGPAWLRRNQEELVDVDLQWVDQRLDEREITHQGRTFTAWRVEATREDGEPVSATVSEALPPFGLYQAETPELRMTLREWGGDAQSTIQGEPLGLSRWILQQVRQAMNEADETPQP